MNKADALSIFGIEGGLVSFPIGEKVGSSEGGYAALEKQLGQEVRGRNGHVARLVRLDPAAGLSGGAPAAGASQAGGRVFTYTLQSDDTHAYDVKLAQRTGTIPANRPVGVALTDQEALSDNDIFWLHVDGPVMEVWSGDDGTDFVIGQYVSLDDDADLGCVYCVGTTFPTEFAIGISLTTETGTDALVKIRPFHKLQA